MKAFLSILFALPFLTVAAVTDVECGPLDFRTGKAEVRYTIDASDAAPLTRLAGIVVDRDTGRSLRWATLLDIPGDALAPGRHRIVWDVLSDIPFRPFSSAELRLSVETVSPQQETKEREKGSNEEKQPGLLFHCSLDSIEAISACGGTVSDVTFVEGVNGMSVQVGHAKDPICFPLENVITNFRRGSVEVWAKILEPDHILASSANELNLVNLRQVNDDIGNFFRITLTMNNGHGQSGLVGGISTHDKASTHIGRIGPFDIAAAIGGNNPKEWHHYRLSWDADGIGGGNDRTAVFVDGRKVVSSTEPLVEIKPAWNHYRYILKISESNGSQPWAVFDEVKLWDRAVMPPWPRKAFLE